MRLDLTDMLYSLSFALDSVETELLGVDTGHGKRVACLSLWMGKEAGFREEELRDFVGCCILHDNALTEFIHEELLKEPDLLKQRYSMADADPMIMNNRHSVIGERNIRLLPFHTDVKNIILYHHENADGTGPMKKRAGETGLKSQILHLADMADMRSRIGAMTEEEFESLSKWIQSQSGRMFSETAVRLFQQAIDFEKICNLRGEGVLVCLQGELQTKVRDYSDREIHDIAGLFARIVDYKFFRLKSMMG